RGKCCGGNSLKFSRVGKGTPTPNASASRVVSEGTKVNRLAAESDTADLSSAWSRSFDMRMAKRVLHWEMMVGSSSAGRWVTNPREIPYLRPSFASRE